MKKICVGIVLFMLFINTSVKSQTPTVKITNGPQLIQESKWDEREFSGQDGKSIYILNKGVKNSQIECINSETLISTYKENINIPCFYFVAPDGIYGWKNQHLFMYKSKLLYVGGNFEKKTKQQIISQLFIAKTGKFSTEPNTLFEAEVVKKQPLSFRFIQSTDSTEVLVIIHSPKDNKFTYKVLNFSNEIANSGEFTVDLKPGENITDIQYDNKGSISFLTESFNKIFIQDIKKNSQKSYNIGNSAYTITKLKYRLYNEKILFAGLCSSSEGKQNIYFSVFDLVTKELKESKIREIESHIIQNSEHLLFTDFIVKENGGAYLIIEEKGIEQAGKIFIGVNGWSVRGNIFIFNYDENYKFKWENKIERKQQYPALEADFMQHFADLINNQLVILYNVKAEDGIGKILNLTMGTFNEGGEYSTSKLIEYKKDELFIFTGTSVMKSQRKNLISFQREKQNYKFTKLSFK